MNVKKKVWYQIDTVGGSRRQKISAVLVLTISGSYCRREVSGIYSPEKKRGANETHGRHVEPLFLSGIHWVFHGGSRMAEVTAFAPLYFWRSSGRPIRPAFASVDIPAERVTRHLT